MHPTIRRMLAALAMLFVASLFLGPAAATPSVNLHGYETPDGGFTFIDNSRPCVPTGATLRVRVWVDPYGCDPVTVD